MSVQHNILRSTGVYGGGNNVSAINMKEPVAHPVNCKHECPYGYDKAFCFPCYKKIMSQMPLKKKV